ncbi:hypothetical protein BGZ76_006325 [Entomortierella beljakovae]|nr:hypothetical protein BGZ76_006325 [Entomortierella beljakovae]
MRLGCKSDASQRKHILTVRFPPGYPAASLILDPLEVPEYDSERLSQAFDFEVTNSKEGLRLDSVVQKAEKQLELLSDFWDVMQDIDEKSWVIDPEKPTRADRTRRNDSKFPRENLEVILELPNGFPSPSNVTKDEMNIECGICYSFRYEGQIPDHLCSNPKCQRPFHRSCLYDVSLEDDSS